MRRAFGATVISVVVASGIPVPAHHSNPLYFDLSKAMTLEGQVRRVEWVNPHVLLFLDVMNGKGESETWIVQGSSNVRQVQSTMKERLTPGAWVEARVWPPRNPLYVNERQTVLLTRPDDARGSSRIVGGGQIRFSNGDVLAIGGGPGF